MAEFRVSDALITEWPDGELTLENTRCEKGYGLRMTPTGACRLGLALIKAAKRCQPEWADTLRKTNAVLRTMRRRAERKP